MTVAVLLLGVPMSIFGVVLAQDSVRSDLQLRTESIARAVETRLTYDLEIDSEYLDRWADDTGDMPMRVTVTTPDGEVVVAGDDFEGNTYYHRQPTARGALVVVEVPASSLFWRGAQVVILVVVASLVAFGVGALVAGRQARRLAAPLIYLAASAEQLGAGRARPTVVASGVEEIDLVSTELVRSGERMAQRMAAEREFAANASHQLRTPLTALTMRLEEIEMTANDPHIADEARISLEQVERLVGVVDDLLSAARSTDGGTTEPLELSEVFEQLQREWGPTFKRGGRRLRFSDPDEVAVLATPGALSQALSTLLENSLKYGDGTTSVEARPSKSGVENGVVIAVSDEGQGVSDDLAPRIFERHVTSGKGTGLGLGLARDLVTADGGRLDLSQRRPAVFSIFLAAVPKHLEPDSVLPPGSMVVVGRRRRRR
ncbi:ATP-binding protein [Pseudactinotalea terrae]|uniref:ATP-binding protein n=1 Tax=Pseudactinotalea terrae TaxID=1743262 RepID=UPI0030C8501D